MKVDFEETCNIKLNPKANCWIIALSQKNFLELEKYKKKHFTCFDGSNIKKDDIIIIYCKDKKKSAFKEILQVKNDAKLNNKINIFKDNNLNKYVVDLYNKKKLQNVVKINDLLNNVNIEATCFKKNSYFQQKFLKENILIKMEYGKKILDTLLYLENITKTIEIKETNTNSDEKEEVNSQNSSDTINSESSHKSAIENSIEKEEEEVKLGRIPIIVVPCEEFNLPKKKGEKYFVSHYKECKKCTTTNNNNKDIGSILDIAEIEIIKIISTKDGFFNPVLDDYYGLENHEPMDYNKIPFIRVAFIDNNHDIYNKCLLISWID